MPSDQVFGRIEKDLRQMENIISPKDYYHVFKKYSTVKMFDKGYMDYKDQLKKNSSKKKGINKNVFLIPKAKKTVGISQKYKGKPVRVPVLKKKKN
jgi:hypothetical protein